MIDQTIPFPALTRGLARCVREWILPHLDDAMARTQAEVLAVLLEGLPDAYGPAARAAIAQSGGAARTLLARHGACAGEPPAADVSTDDLVADTAAQHAALVALADRLRATGDVTALGEVQALVVRSAADEARLARGEGTDFASISTTEGAAKRR
jgi:hypothetical protein